MTTPTCTRCLTRLSKYNPGLECSACETRHITWDKYLADTSIEKQKPGTCKNGHDLTTHGRIFPKGDGSFSRRCLTCRRATARNFKRTIRTPRSTT